MKFLIDANLSPGVSERLEEAGHDSHHVAALGLLNASDSEIFAADEQAGLLLANLPKIEDRLEAGAIATFARGRLRVKTLPIAP